MKQQYEGNLPCIKNVHGFFKADTRIKINTGTGTARCVIETRLYLVKKVPKRLPVRTVISY